MSSCNCRCSSLEELALSKKDSWLARHWPSWGKKTDPVVVFDVLKMPAMALMKGKPMDALYWLAFFGESLGHDFRNLADSPTIDYGHGRDD